MTAAVTMTAEIDLADAITALVAQNVPSATSTAPRSWSWPASRSSAAASSPG
ncbi:MAG: hypothetical protein QOF30_2395 [Acidimicrobiaceae bacterium]|nr:hypothetical protein [Acidimicrobiaceae bacterium]